MERYEIRPGVEWHGSEVVAACHYAEHSIIVRRDEKMSVTGDPRCVVHLVTDRTMKAGEAYQSYYAIKPHQVPTFIERCTPMVIGGERG